MWTACTVTKVGHGLHFGWRLMEPWDLDILWLPADSVPILYNSPGRWPLWEWNGSRNAIFFVSFVVLRRKRFPLWFLSLIIPTSFFPPSFLALPPTPFMWGIHGCGLYQGCIMFMLECLMGKLKGQFCLFLARQPAVCHGLLNSWSHTTTDHNR